MDQNKILEGNLYKNIISFFLPIWFGTFFQQLYNTVDAIIVGNFVGKQALAAVGGATSTIIDLMVGFFVGLASGAGVIIAQYFGSKNINKTNTAIHSAIAIAVSAGVILIVIGVPFSPSFLKAMGTPADTITLASNYIRIYFTGSIFNLVYNIGSGILRAMGDSKKPLIFLIVASIVNIILDIVFVVYLDMGVTGVAIATITAQFVSCVLVVIALKKLPDEICLSFKQVKLNFSMCKEIFHIGIPSGLQAMMFSVSNIIIMSTLNSFGTDAVAAWTAYAKIDAIFWMTMGSFGIVTTTFVGQNFGAKKFDRMKKSIRACNIIALTTSIALSFILYNFYEIFFKVFTSDINVIEIGSIMVKIMAPAYFSFVFIENLSGAMRGVGDSIVPTIITIVGICVFRVFWIWAILPLNRNLGMAIFSYPSSWFITAIAFLIYYKTGFWFTRSCQKKGYSIPK